MVIYTTMKTTQLEIIENLKSLNLELERMLNNFPLSAEDNDFLNEISAKLGNTGQMIVDIGMKILQGGE